MMTADRINGWLVAPPAKSKSFRGFQPGSLRLKLKAFGHPRQGLVSQCSAVSCRVLNRILTLGIVVLSFSACCSRHVAKYFVDPRRGKHGNAVLRVAW